MGIAAEVAQEVEAFSFLPYADEEPLKVHFHSLGPDEVARMLEGRADG